MSTRARQKVITLIIFSTYLLVIFLAPLLSPKNEESKEVKGLKPAYERVDSELHGVEGEDERAKKMFAKQGLQ